MVYEEDTIISNITPTSGGSICMLRLSGKNAIKTVVPFFPKVDISKKDTSTFVYGPLINADNVLIDNIILYVFKAPNSFTGENVVEISCHSNIFIIEDVF